MADAHDDAVFGPSGHSQRLRQGFAFHDQRVVASCNEVLGESFEDGPSVVLHQAGLAVHEVRSADHLAPERLGDGLVAEAHSQNRHPVGHGFDQLDRDAGLLRRARPRRDHDPVGLQRTHASDVDFVVAPDLEFGAEFAEELDEVEGKRIVVVDD